VSFINFDSPYCVETPMTPQVHSYVYWVRLVVI